MTDQIEKAVDAGASSVASAERAPPELSSTGELFVGALHVLNQAEER